MNAAKHTPHAIGGWEVDFSKWRSDSANGVRLERLPKSHFPFARDQKERMMRADEFLARLQQVRNSKEMVDLLVQASIVAPPLRCPFPPEYGSQVGPMNNEYIPLGVVPGDLTTCFLPRQPFFADYVKPSTLCGTSGTLLGGSCQAPSHVKWEIL